MASMRLLASSRMRVALTERKLVSLVLTETQDILKCGDSSYIFGRMFCMTQKLRNTKLKS